jgi:hypothetical protein
LTPGALYGHTFTCFCSPALLSSSILSLFQVEDLNGWLPVLDQLEGILLDFGTKLASSTDLTAVDEGGQSKRAVCAILRFLCLLLKSAKDKRFFLSLTVCIKPHHLHPPISSHNYESKHVSLSLSLIPCLSLPPSLCSDFCARSTRTWQYWLQRCCSLCASLRLRCRAA